MYGGVTLHRITRAGAYIGPQFLESEGLQAMVGSEDDENESTLVGEGCGIGQFPCEPCTEINIITVNVDGLGVYEASAATRMDAILSTVLSTKPDMLLLQEVVAEMYQVVQRHFPSCAFRRGRLTEDYFNVTVLCSTRFNTRSRISSYAFPGSSNGRHMLTVRCGGWTVVNVHAESGGRQEERDERESQLKHISRFHEREAGQTCIIGGDFNVREGEDHCLRREGWRDAWGEVPVDPESPLASWTWRRADHSARYDRCYVRTCGSGSVSCVRMATIMSIHPTSTDHVAVQVVFRRTMHGDAAAEANSVNVQFAQRASVETPLCGLMSKHAEVRRKEHLASSTQELEVSVVAVANAIREMDRAFRRRAEVCLKGVAVEAWIPEEEEWVKDSPMIDWVDLPVEGGFKVFREGPRGRRTGGHGIPHARQVEQVCAYSKYQKWAAIACGVQEAGWRQCLKAARATHKDNRGAEGIPESLRIIGRATERTHAMMLCRIEGLRNEIATQVPPEISGEAFNASASAELERILALSHAEVPTIVIALGAFRSSC